MEGVGGLSPVSTNLPYASQAQGPGSPCFSRGAEQPFPWGFGIPMVFVPQQGLSTWEVAKSTCVQGWS